LGLAYTAGPKPACKQCRDEGEDEWENVIRWGDDWTCRVHHLIKIRGTKIDLPLHELIPNRAARRKAKLIVSTRKS
jgi:hypothetical protein